MKTKIVQFIPAMIVFLVVSIRYVGLWCVYSVSVCYGGLIHQMFPYIITPLFLFGLSFLPIAIVLAFVSRTVFQSWLRLATWFVPLSLFIIFITPVTSNSWMPIFFVSREEISWYLGVLFALISLVLILWKWFTSRRLNHSS